MAAGKFKRPAVPQGRQFASRFRLLIESSKRVIAFSAGAIYIGSIPLSGRNTRTPAPDARNALAKNPSIQIN